MEASVVSAISTGSRLNQAPKNGRLLPNVNRRSGSASDSIQIGGSIGNVHRNAPTVITTLMTMFTLLGMLVITMFISNALLRDFEQGTAELFFASPIRKRDYLAGRGLSQAGERVAAPLMALPR